MSGAAKWFGEFLANTTTSLDQGQPTTQALTSGDFVVACGDFSGTDGDTSNTAVRSQIVKADGTKVTNEFLVNTTTANSEGEPVIAALEDGRFVVAHSDLITSGNTVNHDALLSAIFNPDGTQSVATLCSDRTSFMALRSNA
jgi:hypothetical protein